MTCYHITHDTTRQHTKAQLVIMYLSTYCKMFNLPGLSGLLGTQNPGQLLPVRIKLRPQQPPLYNSHDSGLSVNIQQVVFF